MNAVEYLKQKVDILDLLEHYEAQRLNVSDGEVRCCCPIHGGDNSSAFVAKRETGLWYCHTKCQTGGDIYDLVMLIEELNFKEAVRFVAKLFDIDISQMEITTRSSEMKKELQNWIKTIKKLSIKPMKEFDISTLGKLYPINSYRQFTKKTLSDFNVMYCPNNKRIVVPIYQRSVLVGVTMRCTTRSKIKWQHLPEGIKMGEYIFNADNITPSDTDSIILCEGVWDVLNYHQNNYKRAIGSFGAHLTIEQQQYIVKNTYNLMISFDTDSAGINATKRVIEQMQDKMNIKIANIPEGKDAGELNEQEIHEAINSALTIKQWRSIYETKY